MVADLAVQHAQALEDAVVEVAPEDEGQHDVAQPAGRAVDDARARGDDAAFHPGKAFPFAALHDEVFLQRVERADDGAGVAVGAQGQVDAEDEAVLGDVADEGMEQARGAAEVFLERGGAGAAGGAVGLGAAAGVAVAFVEVDEVDVAGDVELARAELAHADDPEVAALAVGLEGGAVAGVELGEGVDAGEVEGDFGEPGDGEGDVLHGGAAVAVEHGQALHDELAQHAQGGAGVEAACAQGGISGAQGVAVGHAGREQGQRVAVAAVDALHEARVQGLVRHGRGRWRCRGGRGCGCRCSACGNRALPLGEGGRRGRY